jgi:sulfur carrier protein ThiS adenylyltransferase
LKLSTPDLARRQARQRDLVPPERLARCHAVVIGVGSIGRQVALQLAAMGIQLMTLYDHDKVDLENLATQGFWETDVGTEKVHAVANVAHQQYPRMELNALPERFRKSHVRLWPKDKATILFSCVDAIDTRQMIWEAVREKAQFFCDGRMAAEVIRILVADTPALDRYYASTLFPTQEAHAGSCSSKACIYGASIAAGLMIGQFTRWLRRLPIDKDQTFNLLAQELTVS